MLFLDLKLALFVVLVVALGSGVGIWWFVRSVWLRRRSPNATLAYIRHELPFGVVVYSIDGTIVQANAEGHRLLRALQEHCTALQRDLSDLFGAALHQHTPTSGLMTHPTSVRWWSYPLGSALLLLILTDNHEHQRLVSQHHAFVGQLSHELRTPLTALIAHLEIVRNPATNEVLREASLTTIQQESHRLARLVRDLLELHRLEAATDLTLQPTNVVLVAEDAIAQVFPRVEEAQLTLTLETGTALPPVLAHPDRLKQVFLNLLDNAVKFARPDDTIKVVLLTQPQGVHCRISDTGPGIAQADLPRVREPLYRGRTDVEGSGIGLALVGEILRRHHTTLSIESSTAPNQAGTTCSWTLPYAADGEEL